MAGTANFRVVVVGLGVQGYKRRRFAGADFVTSVDPVNQEAPYRRIEDVPLGMYDAALLCVPDEPKVQLLDYLLANGKHALIEKPLWARADHEILRLETQARAKGVVCYTAYNHRFEPHFVRMRDVLAAGRLGPVYRTRMFYGNGTARLVRDSAWRDVGAGVVPDLGSHLLDAVRFWFGDLGEDFVVIMADRFENQSPDHAVIAAPRANPRIELEMTLLQWRNHFTCDVLAEKGTAHIRSLCKWGPTSFTIRSRVLPSGRPPEETVTLVREDPTWEAEYAHFRALCLGGGTTDLSNDLWLNRVLRKLGQQAVELSQR